MEGGLGFTRASGTWGAQVQSGGTPAGRAQMDPKGSKRIQKGRPPAPRGEEGKQIPAGGTFYQENWLQHQRVRFPVPHYVVQNKSAIEFGCRCNRIAYLAGHPRGHYASLVFFHLREAL